MLVLIAAVPGFIIGLDGIGDPQDRSSPTSAMLELLAMVAAAAAPAVLAYQLLWRDKRLGVAGFGRRPAGFIAGYGAPRPRGRLHRPLHRSDGGREHLRGARRRPRPLDDGPDDDGVALTAASLAVAYIISITAGITEEIVFRAYAITRLEELGWRRAAFIVPGRGVHRCCTSTRA